MHKFAALSIVCALAACGGDTPSDSAAGTGTVGTTNTPGARPASGAAGSAAEVPSAMVNPSRMGSRSTPAGTTPATPVNTPAMQPPAAMAPVTTPQAPGTPAAMPVPAGGKMLAMDECGLKTQYPGDEYCINAPAPDKGFQFHVGPSNYENPESKYVLLAGEENVINMSGVSGNDKDIQYYYRQYRMRPGSHHVILTAGGQRIGGTQNLARDNPQYGIIPPENEGIGLPLSARVTINANMHFYNFTDKPMIRELWVNYWYKDPATVKETAKGVFSMTGVSAAVAHSHVVVGASCPVTGTGRVLSFSGHRHLNNVRFSIWHKTGGQRDLVFEDYDSEHPGIVEFNSLTTNTAPNPMTKTMGGMSGILNVKQGDMFDFECEIINDTNTNFVGQNEAADDEMCILTGDTVGAQVTAGCTAITARKVTSPAGE